MQVIAPPGFEILGGFLGEKKNDAVLKMYIYQNHILIFIT